MENDQIIISVQENSLFPLAQKTAEYLKPFFSEPLKVKSGKNRAAYGGWRISFKVRKCFSGYVF